MKNMFIAFIASICVAVSAGFIATPHVSAANAGAMPTTSTMPGGAGDGINLPGQTPDQAGQEPGLIRAVKKGINLLLTFLGLISLCILLYGGFNMVTAAGNEEKYKSGFKILRQAGIGLIFVGIAGLLVNFVFWILQSIAS